MNLFIPVEGGKESKDGRNELNLVLEHKNHIKMLRKEPEIKAQ